MIQKEIDYLHSKGGERDWERWKHLKWCLNEAYKREEELWSRKAKVNRLGEGDKNTRYFHAVTTERRKKKQNLFT